ncbi:hypothetical protein Mucpa_2642 [Mucilaginibacter paludis DSM 18603]|uniref:Uncharacterized protein n=1 Tax=Mucilaginibacter paludis DSM 18603 TaxID=714943 RepID=H1Y4H2_9SPHI|nr:hypothetical protein Mucpa_2642 [Mucilaginibacter paludis DSM 18603]
MQVNCIKFAKYIPFKKSAKISIFYFMRKVYFTHKINLLYVLYVNKPCVSYSYFDKKKFFNPFFFYML